MRNKAVKKLIITYLNKPQTSENNEELDSYCDNKEFLNLFNNFIKLKYIIDSNFLSLDTNFAKQRLHKSIKKQRSKNQIVYLGKIAASLLIFFSISFFTYNYFNTQRDNLKFSNQTVELLLENGYIVQIFPNQIKNLRDDHGTIIAQQKGNEVRIVQTQNEEKYVLNVPNAHKFSIILSDDTKITLNSGTKVEFSNTFISSDVRQVSLEGEAYFEVTPNATVPFLVKCANSEIKVLGTVFNVEAYANEPITNTYLVQGSVVLEPLINSKSTRNSIILTPGDGVRWNKEEKILKRYKSDGKQFTSWIDGKLVFKHLTFKEIKTKLQRHFNVKIHNYDSTLEELQITASFNTQNLKEVLENIKEIHPFTYTIVGDLVTIEREIGTPD